MGVKGVIRNLMKHGVRKTYQIHVDSKKTAKAAPVDVDAIVYDTIRTQMIDSVKAQIDLGEKVAPYFNALPKGMAGAFIRKFNAAQMTSLILHGLKENETKLAAIDKVIAEMKAQDPETVTSDQMKAWDSQMLSLESGRYRKLMKRIFVKEIYPLLYNSRADQPVENKILFMQPRTGLNQSFKYIYNRIKEDYPYEPVLYEFHFNEVSSAEHYINSLDFVRASATAKAVMLHESSAYITYIKFRPETKVIQLWHGCGIIKHLGLSNADKPGFKKMSTFEEFPEHSNYDLVTIASDELKWVFEEFMGRKKGDPVLQAIGVSRTDEFFDPEYVKNCYDKLHSIIPASKDKKVILYAPTYRGKGIGRVAPRELDVAKFAEKLSDDYILIIKQHQTAKNLPEIPEENRDSFAYDMTRGKGMDINELMTVADICISDYSSVVFEFSLFERPIIFFMYDLEDYSDSRGMYYTYEELAECGPICKTNEEVIDYIAHVDERFDKEKVTEFKNRFMSACDGHATERIMNFIESDERTR